MPGTGVPGRVSRSVLGAAGTVVSTVVVVVVTGGGVASDTGALGSTGGLNGGTPGSGFGGSANAEPATRENATTNGNLRLIERSPCRSCLLPKHVRFQA